MKQIFLMLLLALLGQSLIAQNLDCAADLENMTATQVYFADVFATNAHFYPDINMSLHTLSPESGSCVVLDTIDIVSCNVFSFHGQSYTTSGTYSQQINNPLGCDTVFTLNLSLNQSSDSTITQTACDYYSLNGQSYDTSGIYTQTLINAAGCDSIITLNLTMGYTEYNSSGAITYVCEGYDCDGQWNTSSGYCWQYVGTNAEGCNVYDGTYFEVEYMPIDTYYVTTCGPYEFCFETLMTSGTYTCPHISPPCGWTEVLILTIDYLSISQNGASLYATFPNSTYQWIDCATNMPILGATSQTFTPISSGSYKVEVGGIVNPCISDCYTIVLSSIEVNNFQKQLKSYPNPTTGILNIAAGEYALADARVLSLIGQELATFVFDKQQKTASIEMPETAGIYFVEVAAENGEKVMIKVEVVR